VAPLKVALRYREQARLVYYGAVFSAKKKIPVNERFNRKVVCDVLESFFPRLLLAVLLGASLFAVRENAPVAAQTAPAKGKE